MLKYTAQALSQKSAQYSYLSYFLVVINRGYSRNKYWREFKGENNGSIPLYEHELWIKMPVEKVNQYYVW